MTTTLKEIEDEMMNRVDLLFGLAPPESQKGIRVAEVKSLVRETALKIAEAARDAMVVEEDEREVDIGRDIILEPTLPPDWTNGFNSARQESLNRWKTFIGNNEK